MDPRQRYFHGAVDVSTLQPNESRFSDAAGRFVPPLEASPAYNLLIRTGLLAGDDSPVYVGWTPPFISFGPAAFTLILGGLAGTIDIDLGETSPGAGDDLNLVTAGSAVTAGPLTNTPLYGSPAVAIPRMLIVTPTGVAAGAEINLLMLVNPAVPIWR